MKRSLVLFAAALIGCASLGGPYGPYHSVEGVLSMPDRFNDRNVRVCGWFIADQDTCTLSQAVNAPGLDDPNATIWVTPYSDICLPFSTWRKPRATWAVVEGKFRTGGGWGHFGLYPYTIDGGTVKPVRGGCDATGSSPIN